MIQLQPGKRVRLLGGERTHLVREVTNFGTLYQGVIMYCGVARTNGRISYTERDTDCANCLRNARQRGMAPGGSIPEPVQS